MQESMKPIADRTNEHLGVTDAVIIAVRRRLLEAVKALRDDGVVPQCVDKPEQFQVRSTSGVLQKDANWLEGTRDWVRDGPGIPVHARGHLRPEQLAELKRTS
jgi:phthalate 4,5-dioxygenase